MNKCFFYIFIITLALTSSGWALLWTDPPLPPGHPVLFMWNSPTENCAEEFNVSIDLSHFHAISTTRGDAGNLTIGMFYHHRFGIFPYVTLNKKDHAKSLIHHGGVPQLIDMDEHLKKATKDILKYMPTDIVGLGVLDFEEWRPQFVRNWGDKTIFKKISIKLVNDSNPGMTARDVQKQAEKEFNAAARRYFTECLRLGKKLRPKRQWGYYLFPDCYNYENRIKGTKIFNVNYTGECPPVEYKRNDNLWWLWEESTALFPSIYVNELHHMAPPGYIRWFCRYRIQESIRVSKQKKSPSNYSIPIHAYIRTVNKDFQLEYLNETDLVDTIGEAIALGSASVISWAPMEFSNTTEKCKDIKQHLAEVVNPYILNTTTATQLCSKALCQGRGRCLRKWWNDDVYLHLDPHRFQIRRAHPGSPLTVIGSLSQEDVNYFDRWFDCMCFSMEPCRSVINMGPSGPHPVLLVMTLICLTYAIVCIVCFLSLVCFLGVRCRQSAIRV